MNLIGAEDHLYAEKSVLGSIFLDAECLDEVRTILEPRDFSQYRHELIYKVMLYLDDRNLPVDLVTVSEHFQKHSRVSDMGGISYLTEIAESCPTTANVKHYAYIVRSKALRRRGAEIGQKIIDLSREDFETDEEYFTAIDNLTFQLRPQDTTRMKNFRETREKYFKHLNTKAEFILTGFRQFDSWAKGVWRGWLYVLAGRPSVGKTAKVLQMVYGIAKQRRKVDNVYKDFKDAGVVLLYSQEMDENQIKDRMISAVAGVNYNRIKSKKLNKSELQTIRKYYDEFEKLPIFISDASGVTIDEIRSTAKQFKRRYGKIAAVVVDYLQIMHIPQRSGERRDQAIGRVTSKAKQIARDMDCCFILLSQMTRESEKSEEPKLSHLKESGNIEQDADVVEFLWHNPRDTEQNGKVIQSFVAKGRDIGVNRFRYLFKGWFQRYEELPKKEG